MNKVEYEITNSIIPEEYLDMRTSVGWSIFPLEQAANGLGRMVMNDLMTYIKSVMKPGYRIMVSLKAAKGKEGFYKKFGFIERPNEDFGPGMHQWIER